MIKADKNKTLFEGQREDINQEFLIICLSYARLYGAEELDNTIDLVKEHLEASHE